MKFRRRKFRDQHFDISGPEVGNQLGKYCRYCSELYSRASRQRENYWRLLERIFCDVDNTLAKVSGWRSTASNLCDQVSSRPRKNTARENRNTEHPAFPRPGEHVSTVHSSVGVLIRRCGGVLA